MAGEKLAHPNVTAKTSPHGNKKKTNRHTKIKIPNPKPLKIHNSCFFLFSPCDVLPHFSPAIKKWASLPPPPLLSMFLSSQNRNTRTQSVCRSCGAEMRLALRQDLLVKNILQSGMNHIDNVFKNSVNPVEHVAFPFIWNSYQLSCLYQLSFWDATQQQPPQKRACQQCPLVAHVLTKTSRQLKQKSSKCPKLI